MQWEYLVFASRFLSFFCGSYITLFRILSKLTVVCSFYMYFRNKVHIFVANNSVEVMDMRTGNRRWNVGLFIKDMQGVFLPKEISSTFEYRTSKCDKINYRNDMYHIGMDLSKSIKAVGTASGL
jgi:hypothetical protein